MENKVQVWKSGLNQFIEKRLEIEDNNRIFTLKINENEFEPNRKIDDIFFDHLKERGTKKVEVLYSGGTDSELVLKSCINNKISVEAFTLIIKIKNAIVNVSDVYYSEKFCRENNIKQNTFVLNIEDFYLNDKYISYIEPYNICYFHVASHFWLLEKCNSFPIVGGDWPWVQYFANPKVLSPQRLDYNIYDLFMKDKKIIGIPNMISHSYESCYKFIKLQLENSKEEDQHFLTSSFLKERMYNFTEPRIKSYGWENCPKQLFNTVLVNYKLRIKYKKVENTIVWGEQIKKLINTNVNSNNKH